MLKFFLRRVSWFLPVLFAVSVVIFLLIRAMPGDPWTFSTSERRVFYSNQINDYTKKLLIERYGLDQPIWRQYLGYMIGDFNGEGKFVCGAICGNLGPSIRQYGRSVEDILFSKPEGMTWKESRFGFTLRLSALAFVISIVLGVSMGVTSGLRPGSRVDRIIRFFAVGALSIPSFMVGLVIVIILGSELHLIKIVISDWYNQGLSGWLLPAFILGLPVTASIIRLTRTSILEVSSADYVRVALAKGLPNRLVVSRHILRNALIPIVTYLGPALVELITASFVIEAMFAFPGLGTAFITSVTQRDYSLTMGLTLIYAVLIIALNILVDLSYGLIDPQIRVE